VDFYKDHDFFVLHGNFQSKVPPWATDFGQFLVSQGTAENRVHVPFLTSKWAKYQISLKDSGLSTDPEALKQAVIIGHSSGAEFGLVFAQDHEIAGLVLLAPYDKANTGGFLGTLNVFAEKASGMFDQEFRWKDIVGNCGFVVVAHSQKDPFVSELSSRRVYNKLRGAAGADEAKIKYLSLTGKGHDPEYEQYNQILSLAKSLPVY
jgi:hypothetical protein